MAKFKIGDRVKLNPFQYTSTVNQIGVITFVNNDSPKISYDVIFDGGGVIWYVLEKWIELVEPENVFHVPSYAKEYWYNIDDDFSYLGILKEWSFDVTQKVYKMVFINPKKPENFNRSNVSFDKENYKKYLFTQEEKVVYEKEKQDNAFKLDPHEFGRIALEVLRKQINLQKLDNKPFPYFHFSLSDDALDAIRYCFPPNLDYQRHILGIRTKSEQPKNRIPDRVVFDESKGKVTVLISKFNDGLPPYRAYTSKVNVEGGDKYDAQFGFLLSYYKYLTRMYTPQKQKELIERIFNLLPTKRYPYLLGAVETEVLKISDVVKSYKDWEELYVAITEPTLKKNGTWDYLEWKEMLRVHELETKREKQREVQKEIKKHQKEIDRLKKEV